MPAKPMGESDSDIAILKTLWARRADGVWIIDGLKSLTLKPQMGCERDFFQVESEMELMTTSPSGRSMHELLASFGPTDFLLKQSILPVLAWVEGDTAIRCVGTVFVISC